MSFIHSIIQEPNANEEYLDTNNNSNAVNKMMTRLMNATANSLNTTSNSPSVNSNNNNSGEASPVAAGSTVNSNESAGAASSSSLTSLIKVSRTYRSTFTFLPQLRTYSIVSSA